MKILHKSKHKKEIFVIPENLDDLWVLSQSIDPGDVVSSFTERKIKLGNGGDDRKVTVIKKRILLDINTEKADFHQYTGDLRISGKIREGKEDISAGSYHTLNIEPGTEIHILKKEWMEYQVKKIEEYSKKRDLVLVCTMDRENATIFKILSYGHEIIANLKGDVQKKDLIENKGSDFFEEIVKTLEDEDKKNSYDRIIIASPQFWHTYISKYLKISSISNKTSLAVCNAVGENGVNEIMKSTELCSILNNTRSAKEINLVNDLLKNIHKGSLSAYGLAETSEAIAKGAGKELLITEKLIKTTREAGTFSEIEQLLKMAEQTQCEIHIISSDHQGGKSLDGLGGIAAITRY